MKYCLIVILSLFVSVSAFAQLSPKHLLTQGADRIYYHTATGVEARALSSLAGSGLTFSSGQFNLLLTGSESAFAGWDKDESNDINRNDAQDDDPNSTSLLGGNYFAINQSNTPDSRFSWIRSTFNASYGFDIGVAGQGEKSLYFRQINRSGSTITDVFRKVWDEGNDGFGSNLDAGLFAGNLPSYYLDATNLTNVPSAWTDYVGPWTVSGSNVYRTTGNVGIGTALPLDRLHVNSGNFLLQGTSTDGSLGSLRFGNLIGGNGWGEIYYDASSASTDRGLVFEENIATSRNFLWRQNGTEIMRLTGTGALSVKGLSGVGTRMVTVNSIGLLETQLIPTGGDNLGNHTATQILKMGSNLINNDGDPNEGLSFATDGDATQKGELNVELPDFRTSSTTVTYGANPRKVIETYAGDGEDLTGAQVPHTRSYTPTARYSSRDVAGSIGTTQYGWDVLDGVRGLANQTQTEAHVSFSLPANALIGIEVTGMIKDSAGKPHYFKVGGAATEGNTGATGSSEEIALGPVTADWYTSAAGNVAFKVIAPTGSNWANAVIEIRKTYSSSLASLATQIEFRNTDL